ncbi:MAG: Lpg1974 family pore-forming outer membrane protein [Chlamydiales bacterium]|nr:Lpg1974 family pore-forming outer membrane protein [Chlamydiales bacterium]
MNWLLALFIPLLMTTSLFGFGLKPRQKKEECPPPPCCEPTPEIKLSPGYNAPYRIEPCDSWNVYGGISFIYWQARQDNMEFCSSNVSTGLFPFAVLGKTSTGSIVNQDFSYKPGFKLLAGGHFAHDAWESYAEYTWFNSSTSSSVRREESTPEYPGTEIAPLNDPGLASVRVFDFANQKWKIFFQSLDTAIARAYYVGESLIFRPLFGARFAWISQKKDQYFSGDSNSFSFDGTFNDSQSFSSWGAGVLAGLDTSWLLGAGFKMIGNGSVDLLYTRVQTTNAKQTLVASGAAPAIFAFPTARPDFVMPHADLEFGFSWGDYFEDEASHIEVMATYGFQVFWGANLFRQFNSETQPANSSLLKGNLYLQGLTAAVKIDF